MLIFYWGTFYQFRLLNQRKILRFLVSILTYLKNKVFCEN